MFGIGFFELLVIAVLGLLVFGPEKLPEAIRTFAFALARARRSWQSTRRELEQELGMDEIRREIHNVQIMETIEQSQTKANDGGNSEEANETPGEHPDSATAQASDHAGSGDSSTINLKPNQPEKTSD